MQVYKHPEYENLIVLSVKNSPIIQQLLVNWDHPGDLQYDTQQEWYSMSHDTYQKLRRHLMHSATLTPPSAKRTCPVPEIAPMPPPPSKRYRSLQTQTEPHPCTEERHAQTETEKHECVALVRESPPSSIVLPLPVAMAEELATPSPSQLVQPQMVTPSPSQLVPQPQMPMDAHVLEHIPRHVGYEAMDPPPPMDAAMHHPPASSAGTMNSIQDMLCPTKKYPVPSYLDIRIGRNCADGAVCCCRCS